MTEELQKCISGRTEEGFLAGEPARGLGASRRPSGDVRFTGSPARYGARTFGRCFASTRHHRKNIAVQSHTKVSTLNQDLTSWVNRDDAAGFAAFSYAEIPTD